MNVISKPHRGKPTHSTVSPLQEPADLFWSVRRLKASPTPPCGIFNIIISGMRGLGIQIVLLLSCLVLSCCLVRVSKGEQRRLTDSKCYIFSKSSQQLGFRWEGSKVFQGGWPCQVWKEASSLFFWRPQVLYIFEILSANVTQWEGYQVLWGG